MLRTDRRGAKGKTEIHARHDTEWNWDGSNEGVQKWSDSNYILRAEPIGLAGIWDMGCEGKEGIDNDSKNFDLSN